jgi:hypothetical protein
VSCRARLQCDGTCEEDNFHVWAERTSPYSLTRGMRGRHFSSKLVSGLCFGVAHTGSYSLLCHVSPFTSLPSRTFVPSHSNRDIVRYFTEVSGESIASVFTVNEKNKLETSKMQMTSSESTSLLSKWKQYVLLKHQYRLCNNVIDLMLPAALWTSGRLSL